MGLDKTSLFSGTSGAAMRRGELLLEHPHHLLQRCKSGVWGRGRGCFFVVLNKVYKTQLNTKHVVAFLSKGIDFGVSFFGADRAGPVGMRGFEKYVLELNKFPTTKPKTVRYRKYERYQGNVWVSVGFSGDQAIIASPGWMWRQPPRPSVAAAAAESQGGSQRGAAYESWLSCGGLLLQLLC